MMNNDPAPAKSLVQTIEDAVKQARLAYEFSPGSYTASALAAICQLCDAIEVTYTRDFRAPLVEGDDGLDYGWRSIPQRPSADDGWVIADDSKDKKTGWVRFSRAQNA